MQLDIDVVAIVASFVAFVFGYATLQARVKNSEENRIEDKNRIEKLEKKHDALDNRIVEKLSEMEKTLAKIEGKLSIEER